MSLPQTDKLSVITSCSLGGWNRYGEKGLSTLLEFWPPNVDIHLVSEDNLPLQKLKQPERVRVWSLNKYQPANDFYTRHENNKACKGFKHQMYNFREDAYRFSKKVFALRQVVDHVPAGRLIWLDADTVTMKPLPAALLYRLPPDGYPIAFLDRPRYHSECGFVSYNLNHPQAREFLIQFARLYETDEVFKLKEWHDSFVFDCLRKQLRIKGWAIPHTNQSHPFVHSELGQYTDHLKGRRKDMGVSVDHPMYKRTKG